MEILSATEVRKEWSAVLDNAVRVKPVFFKRTRDKLVITNVDMFKAILNNFNFEVEKSTEENGDVILHEKNLNLIETGITDKDASYVLGNAILEYAKDYYNEFEFWTNHVNTKSQLPYIMKALLIGDGEKLGDLLYAELERTEEIL